MGDFVLERGGRGIAARLEPAMRSLIFLIFLAATAQAQLQIVFDYSRDTQGFFTGANAGRQASLQAAGDYMSSIFSPTLLGAISPGGGNTWTAQFFAPGSDTTESAPNITIDLNTILIYAGAQDLGGSLGIGGPGGFSASGFGDWFEVIRHRGNGDFATGWGGALSFDTTTSWYFDNDITTIESFTGQYDFFSVAIHEIGHVLGLGASDSWDDFVNTGTNPSTFTGANASALFGGSVPLSDDDSHWAEDTMSVVFGTAIPQEAAMDPDIAEGTRKYFTALDVAGARDIGYAVIPEPAAWQFLLLAGAIALFWRQLRRAS
jgi:hypothetical protein